jgi:hypothetical protein
MGRDPDPRLFSMAAAPIRVNQLSWKPQYGPGG